MATAKSPTRKKVTKKTVRKVKPSFQAEVWDTLSKIDVSRYIQQTPATSKRPALDYLSWTWAWTLLKKEFPESAYQFQSDRFLDNMTAEVIVAVQIRRGGNEVTHSMILPVMDNWNNAIADPTTRDISDARMRCLVKCIAMFGLGLHLYTKQDAPVGEVSDTITEEQKSLLLALINETKSDMAAFLAWGQVDELVKLSPVQYKAATLMLTSRLKKQVAAKEKKVKETKS